MQSRCGSLATPQTGLAGSAAGESAVSVSAPFPFSFTYHRRLMVPRALCAYVWTLLVVFNHVVVASELAGQADQRGISFHNLKHPKLLGFSCRHSQSLSFQNSFNSSSSGREVFTHIQSYSRLQSYLPTCDYPHTQPSVPSTHLHHAHPTNPPPRPPRPPPPHQRHLPRQPLHRQNPRPAPPSSHPPPQQHGRQLPRKHLLVPHRPRRLLP